MQLQNVLVCLSALAVTTAAPLGPGCSAPTPATSGANYVLPNTGGPTPLPSANQPLKHIVVGHGVQNYTCASAGVKGASVGALAVLHDITTLYPGSGPNAVTNDVWDGLTSTVLRTTSMPIQLGNPSPFPAPSALSVSGISKSLPFIGHHFFDINGTPTFSLPSTGELFKGAKVLGISAPSTADKGLQNEGAVDWLFLNDTGSSVGITKVYRVLTSGGAPAICGAAGETQSVPYTTMYWLY